MTVWQWIQPAPIGNTLAPCWRWGSSGLVLGLSLSWSVAAIARPLTSVPAPTAPTAMSSPSPTLLAQSYLHELPPPPTVPFGEVVPTAAPLPTTATAAAPTPQLTYLVYVNGNSPLILQQVQAIEPTAQLYQYEGRTVIQVGQFPTEAQAQAQVQQLEARGIGASLDPMDLANTVPFPPPSSTVTVASQPTQPHREVEFGQAPANQVTTNGVPIPVQAPDDNLGQSARYLVVLPGDSDELWAIGQQVERLVGSPPPGGIQVADRPHGPHLQVGPFPSRTIAEHWELYLRAFGMDARVYYR